MRITHILTGLLLANKMKNHNCKTKKKLKKFKSRIKIMKDKRRSERPVIEKVRLELYDLRMNCFLQGRVYHRINLTLHKLDEFMEVKILTKWLRV